MLFFTFIKGGGVTPLTGPPNLNGFLSIIRGGVKSLLTNVNKKMFFFNEGFPYLPPPTQTRLATSGSRFIDQETRVFRKLCHKTAQQPAAAHTTKIFITCCRRCGDAAMEECRVWADL